MTKDELIEMAKDAGFRVFGDKIVAADNGISGDASQSIERFAALVAAKEREKILDELRLLADEEGRVTLARKP